MNKEGKDLSIPQQDRQDQKTVSEGKDITQRDGMVVVAGNDTTGSAYMRWRQGKMVQVLCGKCWEEKGGEKHRSCLKK